MKKLLITLSLAVAAVCPADPIQISVTGTAQSTEMGYTTGQSYTFTWTVNDGYTGGSGDYFGLSGNNWGYSNTSAFPWLWSSISGDGLSGTYQRPATSSAPDDRLGADSFGLSLYAGNQAPWNASIGLTVDGTEVQSVYAFGLDISGLDYSDTASVNPSSWLSDYTGTHSLANGGIRIRDESNNFIEFTPTSATISTLSEPSTEINIRMAVEIEWASVSGLTYQVQYSTNLVSAKWFDLGNSIVGNGITNSVFDTTRNITERYYRVTEELTMTMAPLTLSEGDNIILYNNGSLDQSFVFGSSGTFTNDDGEGVYVGNYTYEYSNSISSALMVDYPVWPDSETTYTLSWTNEFGGNLSAVGEENITTNAGWTYRYIPVP